MALVTGRPLRFCMVTTFYPPYNFGGDGIFVQQLASELARRGHRVDVIHCIDSYRLLAGGEPAERYDDHPGVRVHGLRSRAGLLSPLVTHQTGFPWLNRKKIRSVLAQGFDVIHYHNVSLVGGPGVLGFGRGLKVYTPHDYWLVCPTHLLFRYDGVPCRERRCLRCCAAHRRPPQAWRRLGLLAPALRRVSAFLVPSRFSAECHRSRGMDLPFVHLPNFAPEAKNEVPLSAGSAPELRGRPYFLFAGRLERVKGLQTLIPFFLRLQRAELWIAGTGGFETRLRELAQGSGAIRFLGRKTGDELRPLYRDAAALVVPSLCWDIGPLVVAEAFREGTPVIVRNRGGMPELAEEGGGGFVYDTEVELEQAVTRLLDDPGLRREMGARAQGTYRRLLSPEVHLRRYFDVLREGLAGTRTRGWE